MMKHFIIRWAANGLGFLIAGELIQGVSYDDRLTVIIIASLIFSIVNAFIRPIVIILSLPAIILTLGLFTLVVNSLMLYLVTILYPAFTVATFGSAIIAVIIIWIVNQAVNVLVPK